MLAKTGLNNILKRIMSCCELTDELQNDITLIQNDFDESREVLKKFGTVDENEETENYDYIENEIKPVEVEVDNGFKEKYEKLHQQYIDRFFGGKSDETEETEETEETPEETDKDITIDGLFK